MKVTRRADHGKAGHLLISVPSRQVEEVQFALRFLEQAREKPGSQVVIELIMAAARRNGWRRASHVEPEQKQS